MDCVHCFEGIRVSVLSCCYVFLYDLAMVSWKIVAIVQNDRSA